MADAPAVKKQKAGDDGKKLTTATEIKDVEVDDALKARILKQINFYFGDSNYPRDNHLKQLASQDPQGFVPIKDLLRFNRLREMTQDENVVASSLGDSEVVDLSEDRKSIRRSHPLPAASDENERSIFTSPYPADVTWEKVAEFWSQYGKVQCTRLRRGRDKVFDGSCYVEFATKGEAQAAVASNARYPGAPEGSETVVKIKAVFLKEALKEASDKLKKKREQREQERKQQKSQKSTSEKSKDAEDTKGCLLKFNTGGSVVGVKLKQYLNEHIGNCAFVETGENKDGGGSSGFVRFRDAESAQKALKASEAAAGKKEKEEQTEPKETKAQAETKDQEAHAETKDKEAQAETKVKESKDEHDEKQDKEKPMHFEGHHVILTTPSEEEETEYFKKLAKNRGGGGGKKRYAKGRKRKY